MKFQQIRSATSIVTFGDKRFLIDPMLAKMGTYPAVPNTCNTGRGNPDCELPCSVESLFEVDAVIATHLHFDHFDEVAIRELPKSLPLFAQSVEEAQVLQGYGFKDVRVLHDGGIEFEGVTLYRTDCDHGSSSLVTMDGYRDMPLSEKASGVVFSSPKEQHRFYLVGDSIYSQEVVDAMLKFKPDVVAVNAAGAQYPLAHLLIMNQYDVQAFMRHFPMVEVIATHVEGVSHASVTRPMLREFAQQYHLTRLHIPNDGETLCF